jgi:hypothetical protein
VSLIDEALKRARTEAAQQDAARRAPSRPWAPMPLPPLRERRPVRPALVGGALALLLLGGRGVWLIQRQPAIQGPAAAPTVPAAARHPRPAAPVPPARAEEPRVAAAPERRERSDRANPTAVEAPPARADRANKPEREAAAKPDVEAPAGRETATPAQPRTANAEPRRRSAPRAADSVPALEDGKSYVRAAALPGGRKLELRGIAYSDTQPVVLINGKVLSPGEGVEGYTVVAIGPERVELKGAAGTLYLTLK